MKDIVENIREYYSQFVNTIYFLFSRESDSLNTEKESNIENEEAHSTLEKLLEERDSINLFNKINSGNVNDVKALLAGQQDNNKLIRLLKRSDEANNYIDASDNAKGYSPLHFICEEGNVDMFNIIRALVTQEELRELLDIKDTYYKIITPLSLAIFKGHKEILEIIKTLLSEKEFKELLYEYQRDNFIKLLKTPCDSLKSKEFTNGSTCYFPLHMICHMNDVNMFNLIKDQVTQEELFELLKMKDNMYDMTPIFIAADLGYKEIFLAIKDSLTKEQFKAIVDMTTPDFFDQSKEITLLQLIRGKIHFTEGHIIIIREIIDSLLREGNNEKSKRAREKVIDMVFERREDGDLEITHAFRNAIRMEERERER